MRKLLSRIKFPLVICLIFAGAWSLHRWADDPEVLIVAGAEAKIIDGDSFKTADNEFRIYGVDAPEYRQTCQDENGESWNCGQWARAGLETILKARRFDCEVRARDQYQRALVSCSGPDGGDLGAQLVGQGLAVTNESFAEPIYGFEERQAKRQRLGIWKGVFEMPKIWRTNNPR